MNYGIDKEDIELILNHIKDNLGSTIKPQIFIFGSRAKGNHRKYSDIDLLLKAESYDLNALSNLVPVSEALGSTSKLCREFVL